MPRGIGGAGRELYRWERRAQRHAQALGDQLAQRGVRASVDRRGGDARLEDAVAQAEQLVAAGPGPQADLAVPMRPTSSTASDGYYVASRVGRAPSARSSRYILM
jgi:hypothetical protein